MNDWLYLGFFSLSFVFIFLYFSWFLDRLRLNIVVIFNYFMCFFGKFNMKEKFVKDVFIKRRIYYVSLNFGVCLFFNNDLGYFFLYGLDAFYRWYYRLSLFLEIGFVGLGFIFLYVRFI